MIITNESLYSNIESTINYINNPDNNIKKATFIVTSNRWSGDSINIPKSTIIANIIKKFTNIEVKILDINKLNIHICEGNVSTYSENKCGVKESLLKDEKKNPHNILRCWASVNNKDDELYKVVNNLVDSDLVLFFTSVRWGQTNSLYQKLIERLTWLENRHSTLGEDNILKNIKCGIIISGHNFNGMSVLENQRQVLRFYGFDVQNQLCWNYQFTDNFLDESNKSYKNSSVNFFNTIKKYLDHKKNKEIL